MTDAFIGEIRLFCGSFAPDGWELCNGQVMPIAGNKNLYQLIGTTYGGDGVTTFNLPDLRARVPMQPGSGSGLSSYTLGQVVGNETVRLAPDELANHWHHVQPPVTSAEGDTPDPTSAYFANSGTKQYATEPTPERFAGMGITGSTGAGQPHPNIQPYLCVNYIIALEGEYPTPG